MPTLHIEHPITDLGTWLGAFNRFSETRKNAGVIAQRVHQPTDDDKYLRRSRLRFGRGGHFVQEVPGIGRLGVAGSLTRIRRHA